MRPFFAVFSALSAVLAVAASGIVPPQFKHILTGTIVTNNMPAAAFITSPYGHRLTGATYLGGNWTDPTGKLVANVYPNVGGDSGIEDNNGVLHVDTRMTWQFPDGSFAWMHAIGTGIAYVSDNMYIEIETDSKEWNSTLTDRYLIAQGTFSGAIWTIHIFGL